MPKCSKCDNIQGRLNRGALCKKCFNDKINKTINNDDNNNPNSDRFKEDNNLTSIVEDKNLIDFIKEQMIRERDLYEATVNQLNEEVIYLKQEHVQKNKIIDSLMTQLGFSNDDVDVPFNDQNDNNASNESASAINTSSTSESSFISEEKLPQYIDWHPVDNSPHDDVLLNVTT